MDQSKLEIRGRARPPVTVSATRGVGFYHPGYRQQSDAPLLTLLANDDGGVHQGLALTVCGAVADNRYDGWFSESRGGDRVEFEWDGILRGTEYYYHLPYPTEQKGPSGHHYQYPIYTSFRSWSFPLSLFESGRAQGSAAEQLVYQWTHRLACSSSRLRIPRSTSAARLQVHIRDEEACRITGYEDHCEVAHVIPAGESEWFKKQDMHRFLPESDSQGVHSSSNCMLLRRDLHTAYDDRSLTFFPKRGKYVASCLLLTINIEAENHNRELRDVSAIPWPFHFSRLVWQVIPGVRRFLSKGIARRVVRTDPETGDVKRDLATGPECMILGLQRPSSRKRKIKSLSPALASGDEFSLSQDYPSDDEEDEDYLRERGRKRKRTAKGDPDLSDASSTTTVSAQFRVR